MNKFIFKVCVVILVLLEFEGKLFANQSPIITSFSADKYQVLPSETINLSLSAYDPDCSDTCTNGCGLYIRSDMTTWSSSSSNFISISNGTSGSPYQASAVWQAPSTEGNYTITVTIYDSGSYLCGGRLSASASLNILVSNAPPNDPPVISSITADKTIIAPNATALIEATASDPNGDSITYQWTTNKGSVTEKGVGQAIFTAPSTTGVAKITLRVTDSYGLYTEKSIYISVSLVYSNGSLLFSQITPSKITTDGSSLYLVDCKGEVILKVGKSGYVEDKFPIPYLTSCSFENSNLIVGTKFGAFIRNGGGEVTQLIVPDGLNFVQDISVGVSGEKAILFKEGKVVVLDGNNAIISYFGEFGDGLGEFKSPTSVTFSKDGSILIADNGHGLILKFDINGNYLGSFGGRGGNAGEFVQLNSIFVDNLGRVWATDSYKSNVTIFDENGQLLDVFGGYGSSNGLLKTPTGILVDDNIYICSTNSPSIEIYSIAQAPLPNTPPSAPTPSIPQEGSLIFLGSSISIGVVNGVDGDGDAITTEFELYLNDGSSGILLKKYSVINDPSGTTSIDITNDITTTGNYFFRARSFDGKDYSQYSSNRNFSVIPYRTNTPPTPPVNIYPNDGETINSLDVTLTVSNSYDADSDTLYYIFEILKYNGDTITSYYLSSPVPQGNSVTSFVVPPQLLESSQTIFFRVYAYDGIDYSQPSQTTSFKTQPIELPSISEYGYIPSKDTTRDDEIRYLLPPSSSDLTLYYEDFSIGIDEVTILINGEEFTTLSSNDEEVWSLTKSLTIPFTLLLSTSQNILTFKHNDLSSHFGIRNVGLQPVNAPQISTVSFNTVVDINISHLIPLDNVSKVYIYRSGDPNVGFEKVGEVSKEISIYRDTNLVNGTSYYYRASYLYSDNSEGVKSLPVLAEPHSGNVTPITDLTVKKVGSDIVLEWTPITNDPPLSEIEVYSSNYSNFVPDTQNFSNILTVIDANSSSLILYGRGVETSNEWYSLIPLDGNGMRGLP